MDARKNSTVLLLFIGLSLLFHFTLLVGFYFARWEPTLPMAPTVFVDLAALPPPAFPLDEQKQPKQIAESEAAPDATPPKDAKYLGERSQNVKEETKSKVVDSFRKGGAPSKAGDGKSLSLKDLAPATRPITPPSQAEIDGFRKLEKMPQVAQNQSGSGGAENALENQGSATNDFLKDVKESDRTMLSTKEFVYFGYYRRIRERLEVAWNSRLRSTLDGHVYGGRALASDRNYVTGLNITLDRNGHIVGIQVLQKSGARELDQAAVDAFNQAGPFPDPPAGLVDDSGHIKIRWDFILQS